LGDSDVLTMRDVVQFTTNQNVPELKPGQTVKVMVKVVEGSRERLQPFEGVVIKVVNGGPNRSFTVRRLASHGIGVERTFLMASPRIDKVEILREGKVRRARLYFLRGRTGKAARLKEKPRPRGVVAPSLAALAVAVAEPEPEQSAEPETVSTPVRPEADETA
jgi:large subunit ribosomal protein L19